MTPIPHFHLRDENLYIDSISWLLKTLIFSWQKTPNCFFHWLILARFLHTFTLLKRCLTSWSSCPLRPWRRPASAATSTWSSHAARTSSTSGQPSAYSLIWLAVRRYSRYGIPVCVAVLQIRVRLDFNNFAIDPYPYHTFFELSNSSKRYILQIQFLFVGIGVF